MKNFKFYSDEKVTVWKRNRFTVKAETLEEAVRIVQSHGNKSVSDMECEDERITFNECETLFDTQESTGKEENFCEEHLYMDKDIEAIKAS